MTDIQIAISNLQHNDPEVRLAAVIQLEELGDTRAIGPLQQVVEDETELEEVRDNAVAAIGEIGGEQAFETLVSILLTCSDSKMRAAAAIVIEWFDKKTNAAIEALIAALKDPDEEVRFHAAQTLGFTDESRAVKPLISALSDVAHNVRWISARALGYLGDLTAVPVLISVLKDDPHEKVRAGAADALGEMGEAIAVQPLLYSMNDESYHVWLESITALKKLNSEAVAQKLESELSHPDLQTRRRAVEGLGRLREKRFFDKLLEYIHDDNEDLRCAAIRSLGELQDKRAVEYLNRFVDDSSRSIRDWAVWSLNRIKDPGGEEALIFVSLNDPELWIRHRAIVGLGEIGTQKAIETLTKIAETPMAQPHSSLQPNLDIVAKSSLKKILERVSRESVPDDV